MAVYGTVKVDNRPAEPTYKFAVLVIKAIDEDGNSLGPQRAIFAHNGATFTGAMIDLAPCCGLGT